LSQSQRIFNINIPPNYPPPPPPVPPPPPPIPVRSLPAPSLDTPTIPHPLSSGSMQLPISNGVSMLSGVGTSILTMLKNGPVILVKGVLGGAGVSLGYVAIDGIAKAIKGEVQPESKHNITVSNNTESNHTETNADADYETELAVLKLGLDYINKTKILDNAMTNFERNKANATNIIAKDFELIEKEWDSIDKIKVDLNNKKEDFDRKQTNIANILTKLHNNLPHKKIKIPKVANKNENKKYLDNIFNNSSSSTKHKTNFDKDKEGKEKTKDLMNTKSKLFYNFVESSSSRNSISKINIIVMFMCLCLNELL